VGTGAKPNNGDSITVHYTGWLSNGTKFDSSRDSGQPFDVQIGAQQVIPGWDEGIPGMKVGGKRRLTFPPALGYGATPPSRRPSKPNAAAVSRAGKVLDDIVEGEVYDVATLSVALRQIRGLTQTSTAGEG